MSQMWIKNGVLYQGGGVIVNHVRHFNPTPEQFEAAGYVRYTPPIPVEQPKRYSKRKVILAFGDGWADKKAELEAAGVYDLFVNSQYLCTDDPTFAAIYENLTDEEKHILDTECIYED